MQYLKIACNEVISMKLAVICECKHRLLACGKSARPFITCILIKAGAITQITGVTARAALQIKAALQEISAAAARQVPGKSF